MQTFSPLSFIAFAGLLGLPMHIFKLFYIPEIPAPLNKYIITNPGILLRGVELVTVGSRRGTPPRNMQLADLWLATPAFIK